jgi:hypothetical protein
VAGVENLFAEVGVGVGVDVGVWARAEERVLKAPLAAGSI